LIKLDAEKAAGKFLNYGACDFNAIFFAHSPPSADYSAPEEPVSAFPAKAACKTLP
jgi:hypothetical protein